MKKTSLLLILLGYATNAVAQARSGGFGNFFTGSAYNVSASLQDNLRAPDLLGNSAKTNDIILVFGGAGYSIRPPGIVLGGSGFFYDLTTSTDRGTAKLTVAGGFFDVGYAVLRGESIIGFPYFGFGGIGATTTITNTTADNILNFGGDKIGSSASSAYGSGGIAFELGFSMKYIIEPLAERSDSSSHVGLIIGADAGAAAFPSISRWQNNASDLEIITYSRPFIFAPYARITVGLSVLKLK